MARQFSIPTLLRMTPNVLLEKFFSSLGLEELGVAWDRLREREIDPVLNGLYELPGEQLDRVETAMRSIYELSSASGGRLAPPFGRRVGPGPNPQHDPGNGGLLRHRDVELAGVPRSF